jgi:glycyl-tRNA synthetase beta chain
VAELLFELGAEELPARFVGPALAELTRLFTERCQAIGLTFGQLTTCGTPRRLALRVSGLLEKTPDTVKEVLGPSVKAAFDANGQPTKPATKFAESLGLKPEQLQRFTTAKGEYVGASVSEKGQRAHDLLPAVLDACVRGLVFPKAMRWGDVEASFGRPLQWVVALLGSEIIPVVYADVRSGRQTRGHRFLAPGWISLESPADYVPKLEAAHVMPDITKRRAVLVERLAAVAASAKASLVVDEELVDQVVNLVEIPHPVVGQFEARHLDLPSEVLISEMKGHQRYFALHDGSGTLLPRFIAVSNTPVKDVALSVRGYERVLKARLTDGRFFFDEDRKTPLSSRLAKLERRTWVAGLGTMAEKTQRVQALALKLAQVLGLSAHAQTIERAAHLCKADLETGMVGEFPELQGVMGREYALHDQEPAAVADAIFQHYLPRNAQDALPTSVPGAIIGLADRLDSIVGLFSIGKRPTGAKDDYAQRRACLAIINVTLAQGWRYELPGMLKLASEGLAARLGQLKKREADDVVHSQVLEFFRGRLESLWREKHRADLVEAVLSHSFVDVTQAQRRVAALSQAATDGGFGALAATFKRVGNIVEKQAKDVVAGEVQPSRLTDAAEKTLFAELSRVGAQVRLAAKADDYQGVMREVVTLKPHVDRFFDEVMVMAEDKSLKENRVRLLMEIGGLFSMVGDFSKVQVES